MLLPGTGPEDRICRAPCLRREGIGRTGRDGHILYLRSFCDGHSVPNGKIGKHTVAMTKQTSVASGDGFAEFLSGMWRRTDQQERGDLPRCGVRLKTNPEKSPFIGSLLFVIPGLIVAIYGIYDAYATAKQMNAGEIPYRATLST